MKLSIYFDGGVLYGNPGDGYGNFEVEGDIKFAAKRIKLSENKITNNQAKYMTLIAALNWLINNINKDTLKTIELSIWTDSKLVEGQLFRGWRVKHPNIRPLVKQAGELLSLFNKNYVIRWH